MTPSQPSHTAEAVCLMRAVDRVGPHASHVIDDPYAAWFLSPPFRAVLTLAERAPAGLPLRAVGLPGLTRYVQVRHRWMDDRFVAALEAGRVDQVLVLGAGYDMRAFRFADRIGARPVFEVDYPSTGERKARILAEHRAELPTVDVRAVPIDFQTQTLPDVLLAAGFRPDLRTFVFWEGVSMYLERGAVEATLTTLRTLGATAIVMDFWSGDAGDGLLSLFHRFAPLALNLLAEPVTFHLDAHDAPALFEGVGWRIEELAQTTELAARYPAPGRAYPGMFCVWAGAGR